MATVRLGRYEVEDYDLPKVCMRCGARAVVYKERRFRWSPGWVIVTIIFGIIPYFIISEVTTRRLTVWVPYCEEHRRRPLWPVLVSVGSLIALIGLTVLLIALFHHSAAAGLFCVGGVPAFFVWCIAAAILTSPAIRPTEITERSITLRGVSDDFIDALEADRRGDDETRPRRRARDEDDYDDRPRGRRRAADEDGGYYDPGAGRRRHDREDDEED
jgi:hypothetical protein